MKREGPVLGNNSSWLSSEMAELSAFYVETVLLESNVEYLTRILSVLRKNAASKLNKTKIMANSKKGILIC